MKNFILRLFSGLLISLLCLPIAFAEDPKEDNSGRDDTQVFHIYGDVDLVSTLKIQYGTKPPIFVKSIYPRLEADSSGDSDSVTHFNIAISDLIHAEVSAFQAKVTAQANLQKKLPKTVVKNNLYIDYDSVVTTADGDHLISIRFSIQSFLAGMAHPDHHYRVFNFNLDEDEVLTLPDLFIPNANYLQAMADYATQALKKHALDAKMLANGTAAKAENYKNWNIKPNGLLITFEEGQVAPYVNGAITVLIPYSALQTILNPELSLSHCAKSKKKCLRTNLLTGGFIDEAFYRPHRVFNPTTSQA